MTQAEATARLLAKLQGIPKAYSEYHECAKCHETWWAMPSEIGWELNCPQCELPEAYARGPRPAPHGWWTR